MAFNLLFVTMAFMADVDYISYFKGKRITLMGLGLLGRGIGVARFLAENGAILTVTDLKSEAELAPALLELKDFPNIKYVLGGHQLEDFQTADLILRAPNVPLNSLFLQEAQKNNIPIKMDASLFCELLPSGVKTVGITGTRGKSTVTALIYEILKADGKKVFLGGNIRGVATLPLLKEITSKAIVVLELDSWQLQGFGDDKISPNIAVFTTFFNDHMNYYQGDMDRYLKDKANIFLHQRSEDTLILGRQVENLIKEKFAGHIKSNIVVANSDLPASFSLKMVGEHNRYNASLALSVAKMFDISDDVSKKVITSFSGVPGRLEILGEKKGVLFINDNNATSPEAVIAGVGAFPHYKGKIVLIGGGADKELDFTEYGQKVPDLIKTFILFPGSGTEKIKQVLPVDSKVVEVNSMTEAVKEALTLVSVGDMIMLSPGAASFGVFNNEYERNDQFVEQFNKI